MKKVLFLCMVFVIFGFMIFNNEHNIKSNKQLNNSSILLAFGDSITYGYGANKNESYPSYLQNMLNMKVINSGISGEISADGLKRLSSVIEKTKPDVVIVCHGGNDILRKYNIETTKENIKKMLELIRNTGAEPILVGVPSLKGLIISTDSIYKDIAKEDSVIFEGEIIEKIIKSPNLKSDQIHPNKDGYYEIAESLNEVIRSSFIIIE